MAEDLSARLLATLSEIDTPTATDAADAIEDLTDPDYSLVNALRHGVIFHHGKVPDSIRGFIEAAFARKTSGVRYVFCTSTLLEGVNTPADRLFILTPRRGKRNLSPSAFRNLAGRVGRFGDVFALRDDALLEGLRPSIIVLKGETAPTNFNVGTFIKSRADLRHDPVDAVENPLLEWSDSSAEDRTRELERLENIEPDTVHSQPVRLAATAVGRAMFTWGVFDFDIIDSEISIASRLVDVLAAPNQQLQTSAAIIDAIVHIFFDSIDDDSDALSRLWLSEEARGFYSMFLDWKRQAFPLKRMIRSFLRYWEDSPAALIWVGASWGDTKRSEDEHLFSYVRKSEQTRAKLVNLAIARIKDESDFVSFRLMRYIEVLNELEYISPSAFSEIRFGTDDPWMVRLLRSGLSVELVRLLRDEYYRFVQVDTDAGDFELMEELISAMERDSVNGVLLYEARSWIDG